LIYLFIIMAVPKAIGGLQLFDMVKSGAVVGQVTETAKANGGTLPADLSVTAAAFLPERQLGNALYLHAAW
jgi:hypothetical protein